MMLELGTKVQIKTSGEQGEVIGRAEYTVYPVAYLVRYRQTTGNATEQWWEESAIQEVAP